MEIIEYFLNGKGINYQKLPVSISFHSSFIDPYAQLYCNFMRQKSFHPPQIPFISCSRADILTSLDGNYFWEVIRKPILFQKVIQKLEKIQENIYLDLGPSGTLATLVKYNLKKNSHSRSFNILSPFGRDLKNLDRVEFLLSPN